MHRFMFKGKISSFLGIFGGPGVCRLGLEVWGHLLERPMRPLSVRLASGM